MPLSFQPGTSPILRVGQQQSFAGPTPTLCAGVPQKMLDRFPLPAALAAQGSFSYALWWKVFVWVPYRNCRRSIYRERKAPRPHVLVGLLSSIFLVLTPQQLKLGPVTSPLVSSLGNCIKINRRKRP
jgi:hypothetical protein